MYLKWIGLALIIISLMAGLVMATNLQIFQRVEPIWARLAEDPSVEIVDRVVPVPPYNRTDEEAKELGKLYGWVGFNVTLPNQGKVGYEAYGVIVRYNTTQKPNVVMGIVNATPTRVVNGTTIQGGFDLLTFDGFSDQAWNASKVYVHASLSPTKLVDNFQFEKPDGAPKYCVLFRGRENGTDDTLVLISIKEAWLEPITVIPKTSLSYATVGAVAVAGTALVVVSFRQTRKRRGRRRLRSAP